MRSLGRVLVLGIALCLTVYGVYWKVTTNEQAALIAELQQMQAEMEARLAEREAMIERLSREERLAHLEVMAQEPGASRGEGTTTVRLIELDGQGAELARQQFEIPGHVIFVDAWTISFGSDAVANGHPLMGRPLVLFRRMYSDQIAPKDGFRIDTPGGIPAAYAVGDASKFEQSLWAQFWKLAQDRQLADRLGIRVAQGQAVYKPMKAGERYELILSATGGLSLKPLAEGQDEPAYITATAESESPTTTSN